MFSSANNNNDDDNPLESLFKRPSFQLSSDLIQNPISKPLDQDPPFFSSFPSPFFDEHELPLNQILPRNLLMTAAADQTQHNANNSHEYSTKKETTSKRRGSSKLKEKADGTNGVNNAPATRRKNLGAVPRKRTGKKDRHSKICTAQGIRDRRMRLSLQVARKFFDLQDMLGYDKASKTIEWLFNKSKKAIKDLTKEHPPGNNVNISVLSDAKSESLLSECEVVSGIEETSNTEIKEGITQKNEIKASRKINHKVPNVRESREKARARARSRTREKMMIKHLGNCKSSPNIQSDVQKLGSSNSPFDQDSGEKVSPYDADDYNPSLMQEFADEGTIEKLLLGNSSSAGYNHHCSATAATVSCCAEPSTNFMGFLGNWEVMYNDRMNSGQFSVTNQQVSLAGEQPSSIYSSATTTTANFPLFQQ